jgi:hypothetical protein
MTGEKFYSNGINGKTGDYLLPPLTPGEMSKIVQEESLDENRSQELKRWHQHVTHKHLGPREGIDPKDLSQTGWGVIFAFEDQKKVPAYKEALKDLLDLRREQAGDYYREYTGEDAYRKGETKTEFLERHFIGPGPADPVKMPYYLLIVGDPDKIPFSFQYQLDVQYAVGRIHFQTMEEYFGYARSVAMAEKGQITLPKRASFFGVQNEGDMATELSAMHLIEPMAQNLDDDLCDKGWKIQHVTPAEALKSRLTNLLGGDETPALLFTASHGMGFPIDDPRQATHQGALLCGDWPGPEKWQEEIPQKFYLAADDIGDDARLLGLLSFHFACYGAGTPEKDDFFHRVFKQPKEIASKPFLSRLPLRLLGHPKGGALAVIGHVERAWGCSFIWKNAGSQLAVFEDTLKRLMNGHPVGSAVEYFNQRYAELSTRLTEDLKNIDYGKKPDDLELSFVWTANNDARNYVILGDPAVRLCLGETSDIHQRQTISPVETEETEAAMNEKTFETSHEFIKTKKIGSASHKNLSYLPRPSQADQDPELHAAWREHIIAGFKHNEEMFKKVLEAFMKPYQSTVWMYRILFAIGVLSFLVAAVMSALTKEASFAMIFGGLGIAAFLSYFISRPLQALEENLQFITWLGVVYNTYWTKLANMTDPATIQEDLQTATRDATAEIEKIIVKHSELRAKRPGIGNKQEQ